MDKSFVLGAVEVRPVERELRIDGQRVAIGARAFDVLLALLERRHRVVTKNELLDLVWPDIVVDENSVQAQVSQLRKVLGPKAIATIPGRGYRFALPIGDEERIRTGAFAEFGNTSVDGLERVVGREVDLEAVMALLDQHRLVTIAGTGGIGKTTLAHAVVVQRAGRHAHGVAWVDLTSITAPEKIATAIANAADLHLGEGQIGRAHV